MPTADLAARARAVLDTVRYVVLGTVDPDGMELGEMGPQVTPLRRVTFLDAAGDPIAAEVLDGTGGGPDGEKVKGLPSITAYPGLRGDTIG